MSSDKDGSPCPPCRAGHCSDCVPWRGTLELGWTYCTCATCAFDDEGPEPWNPTDAELEEMARRHFAEKEES